MGLSTTKAKQESKSTETTDATVKPIAPQFLLDQAQDFVGRVNQFGNADPYSFVAPASGLQRQAFSGAQNLGGYAQGLNQARDMVSGIAGRGPNTAGNAGQYTAQGYNAPTLGAARGYSAPNLGQAQSYNAARINAPTMAQQAMIDPTTSAVASNAEAQSLLDGFERYQSPYTNDVVNSSLNDFDVNAERTRAAQAAQGARDRAFGGSRFGIREAATEGELSRARAALGSGLRDQGFRTAAGLSQSDAANRQQANLFNAQNQTGVSQFNAGAANNRALAQAGFGQQANLFNAGAQNDVAMSQAQLDSRANEFGAGANNQFALSRAGMEADASRFGAEANNQFALSQAGFNADAARFGADAANQASQFNTGAQNDFARFNAGQMDAYDARGLQAAGMLGDFGNQFAANQRADLGLQADLGEQQRMIEQAYATAPLSQLQALGTLNAMTPYQILVGQQTQGTNVGNSSGTSQQSGSLFGSLLGLGSLASSFIPSDRRLKRNIERLGTRANGLGIYRYGYLWDDENSANEIGVMADEVAQIVPEALGPVVGGFATVNYAMIGE
jgi:hypothetical protein